MKIRKLSGSFVALAFLAGTVFSFFSGAKSHKSFEAKAGTDVGTVTVNSIRNNEGEHFDNNLYLVLNETTALPNSWDYEYSPVDELSGVFINGVKQGGAIVKHANGNDIHYGLPRALNEGETVQLKGTFSTASDGGYTFSIDFTAQRFSGDWVRALEDYDKVSLADANLPNFVNVAINTEDAQGHDYVANASDLPKKKGFFGLTNETGSYAFQFNFKKGTTSPGWIEVRIGGSGRWGTGHLLTYKFSTEWAINGCGYVFEHKGNGNIWAPTQLHASPEFNTNLTSGTDKMEMGAIKVKGFTNKHLVFFKTNDVLRWSDYWDLDSAGRTTKVGLYYAQSDAQLTNSIDLVASEQLLIGDGTLTDLHTNTDICPAVHNSDDYFMSVDGNGLKFNGVNFGTNTSNYFHKTGATSFSLDLEGAGINTTEVGDLLYIGGMFKAARTVDGVLTLFKFHLADTYFEFDGSEWGEISDERYAEILQEKKNSAKDELDVFVDSSIYDSTNLAIVSGIVNDAKDLIDAATTIEAIVSIVETAKENIAAQAKTKQVVAEEAIMASDTILDEYLEPYDVITTTDLSCVGDMVFLNLGNTNSYSTGGLDDAPTTRFVASGENQDGNVIFQFNYSSTNPNAREYASQVFIRMRGTASNCYRFDIGTDVDGHSGVGLCKFANDAPIERITFDSNFQANTTYKIECGCIDLDGYERTLLFIKINNVIVLKEIVNSFNEHQPTILIMDSFTTDDEVTRLSSIEGGTTKGANYQNLLGRLILDNTSNKNNLYATLSDNSLPENAILLPFESGAFTINGNEVNSKRSITNITKIGQKKYRIDFDSSELADGDVVHIGGYYSYSNNELVKYAYRLFGTEFVYHETSNSWTQAVPTDRETILYEAKQTLNYYGNLSLYSVENQQRIQNIKTSYAALLEAAATDQIPTVLAEALAKIDEIPTILTEAKTSAKNELASYKADVGYRDEEENEKNQILANAYAEIDAAPDQATINEIVATAKTSIDGLKTASQRDAEDLAAKKKSGKAEITSLSSLLESDRYSDENYEQLTALTVQAMADIEKATSEQEVADIVAKYKNAIKAIKTNDGTVFNGETYVKEEKKGSNKKLIGIIVGASVGGLVLIGGGVTAAILLLKKKRRKGNEKD